MKNNIILAMVFLLLASFTIAQDDYSTWKFNGRDGNFLVSQDDCKYVRCEKVDNAIGMNVCQIGNDYYRVIDTPQPTFYKQFKDQLDQFKGVYENNTQTSASLAGSLNNLPQEEKNKILQKVDAIHGEVNQKYGTLLNMAKDLPVNNSCLNFASRAQGAASEMSGYSNLGSPISYKTLYMEEALNLVESYVKDDDKGQTAEFASLFDQTKSNYISQVNFLSNPPPTPALDASYHIRPEEFLDKPLKNYTKRGLKMDFNWAGVNDLYKYYSQQQILLLFYHQFGGSAIGDEAERAKFQRNMSWFLNIWPPASETLVMANNYNTSNGDYDESNWRGKQSGQYKNNFHLDEYGMPRDSKYFNDENQSGYSAYYSQEVNVEKSFAKQTGSYNNRGYGYRYGNSTNTTVKLAVGGRSYELQQNIYTSPIVLDMDGDNKLQASDGEWTPHPYRGKARLVEFDMDGDGFVDLSEWVGPNDGILLVHEKGREVTPHSFFGEAGGFREGYEKLACLDKNGDKVLTGEELQTLSVWQDKNGNAKVDEGEITSIAKLGITEISVTHEKLVSHFIQDGKKKMMWDWYPSFFVVKKKKE